MESFVPLTFCFGKLAPGSSPLLGEARWSRVLEASENIEGFQPSAARGDLPFTPAFAVAASRRQASLPRRGTQGHSPIIFYPR